MISPILQSSAASCVYLTGPRSTAWRGALFLLLVGTVAFVPSLAVAAPSNGQVWTFHQPDGTPFQARVIGDEFFAYYETPDGSVIQEDANSSYWYYSVPKSDGSLIRTEFRVGDVIPKSVVLNTEKSAWLEASEQIATARSDQLGYGASSERLTPAAGTVRGVLLFANFSDTSTTFTDADLDNLLNTVGYNSNGALGSVRDYYYESSYGALTLQIDVYTCTLPQTRAWYGQNTGGAGSDANARQMISDAIAAVDASVDFSIYDADGDGRVDIFGVAHQGQGEESGGGTNAIWSHTGNLASAVAVDGKTIRSYFTVPERYGATTLSTIGVYCHEMAHHMFSLPDLYDLDGGSNGVGSWSLMGYGGWLGPNGAKPCHLDPWCKMALGWLAPTRVTSAQSGIALPNFDENASALLIPIDPYQDGEYFLVCNRYKRSTAAASTGFDQYLPGSGALILHIDDYVRDNKVETLKKVDVEEADGSNHLDNQANLGDSGDLYPNGASAFTGASTPNTKANDGTSTGIVVDTFTGAGTALMTCSVTPMPGVGSYLGYDAMGTSGNGYGFTGIDYGVVHFTTGTGGTLERVRTYFLFPGTTNYTVDVFSGWSGGAPTGLLTTQSGSRAGRGPVEIPLTTPQNFAPGSDFYIRVKYDSGYLLQYVLPIESDAYCDGRSWVSNDGITYIQMTQANNLPYDLNIRADFTFTTGITAGPITATTSSPTNSSTIEFSVEFSADVQNFNDSADLVITETGTVAHTGASITGGPQDFTVTVTGVTGDGTIALAVSTASDVQDTSGNPLSSSVTSAPVALDNTGPNPPNVSGTTPTGDSTPTWNWTSGGGGNGSYRYQVDSEVGSWTSTTGTSYTQGSPLSDGVHSLYVQERDTVGNWSTSGSFAVTIDSSSLYPPVVSGTTPTNDTTPTWTWTSGGGIGSGTYRYQLDSEAGNWNTTVGTSYAPGSALSEGSHTLYVQEEDGPSNWSTSGSFAITIDITAPNAPSVGGSTPTNDTTPTWTWASGGGGGNGNYRYQLDSEAGTWTTTTGTWYTPSSALSESSHTLYVQEQDDAGNWSMSGSLAITIDATGPNPPSVSGTTPTKDTTPAWTWTSGGGGGNGNFRYQLDSESGTWTTTTNTSYSPGTALSEGDHTLYVQEEDGRNNWSDSGSFTITIDTTGPGEPTVSGTTPTNDTTPTWTWFSGGGGNGNYRYKLDDSDLTSGATLTTGTTFTPASPLTDAAYTLYVQERDDVGNWSASGSFTITIDTSGLYPPIVSGLTPTNDTTPTWTWISSEGIGSGNYRYQLNSESGTWTTTTNTLYSPGAALPEGDHTLYVQEEDGPNNWSDSGSFTITIDTTGPGEPTVSGTTPTNDTTPTWTWFSGGGGNGHYRYKLDDNDLTTGATLTTSTIFSPVSPLSDAVHTLYVQERDDAGNWSVTGAFAITLYAGYYPPGVSALSVPRFTEKSDNLDLGSK